VQAENGDILGGWNCSMNTSMAGVYWLIKYEG
jgi:hypothetical protein